MRRYIVVAAPGCYGDSTRVHSAHATLAQAQRACGGSPRLCVRAGHDGVPSLGIGPSAKGDEWLRVYEQGNPILYRPEK